MEAIVSGVINPRTEGQKLPVDVVGTAVLIMEIAAGRREGEYEEDQGKDKAGSVSV